MKALISDIHSNLEALQAVLEDIRKNGVDEIYCLGDIVGYGPNPRECVDHVMQCKMVLLGNHDQGAMFDPEGFNPPAERAIFWTRSQLESPGDNREAKEKRWEFLAERPRSFRENGLLFVHGSARNPLNEYVFPEDIYNQRKMERIFALVERYCFQGHTHVPGIFTENLQFHSPEEIDYTVVLKAIKKKVLPALDDDFAKDLGEFASLAELREDVRRRLLAAEQRKLAPLLHRVITQVAEAAKQGNASAATAEGKAAIEAAGFKLDYLEIRDAETLRPAMPGTQRPLRVLVAAWLGKTRLIDNIGAGNSSGSGPQSRDPSAGAQ